MKSNLIFALATFLLLTGCEALKVASSDNQAEVAVAEDRRMLEKLDLLKNVVSSLAHQLFLLEKFDYENKTIATTNFVWADSLSSKQASHRNKFLEYYLSDSLKVEFVQRGCNVVEYQSPSSLSITDKSAFYLSRDLKELPENIHMDYILVGTLLEMDKGVMTNVEVIDIKTKIIVASAKEYIPITAFYERNNVMLKNNLIYRDSVRN